MGIDKPDPLEARDLPGNASSSLEARRRRNRRFGSRTISRILARSSPVYSAHCHRQLAVAPRIVVGAVRGGVSARRMSLLPITFEGAILHSDWRIEGLRIHATQTRYPSISRSPTRGGRPDRPHLSNRYNPARGRRLDDWRSSLSLSFLTSLCDHRRHPVDAPLIMEIHCCLEVRSPSYTVPSRDEQYINIFRPRAGMPVTPLHRETREWGPRSDALSAEDSIEDVEVVVERGKEPVPGSCDQGTSSAHGTVSVTARRHCSIHVRIRPALSRMAARHPERRHAEICTTMP